ncbi:MAG: ATP-binding cassette domain-containing protein [Gammaproteobacteria bacterium]|nr:ATP-binding cassette domain-containing protein [Gammaproteobacteria bacterium]MDH5653986.1 ATP-binding cassette domain-containing protein [Gammaproteobacteria bacterium]
MVQKTLFFRVNRLNKLEIKQLAMPALGPVDFAVAESETVTLTGPSGSGKSLLLRAMVDLLPHSGEVCFAGQCCEQTHPVIWRAQIGLLPAESFWWSDRVGDHFPPLSDEQLRWFGRLDLDRAVLDWQVSRCSTGERQRLALLRLLCHGPRVLLLDEATANLDQAMTLQVEQLIKTYQQLNRAPVLWVSHDMAQTGRIADRQLRLGRDGQITEVRV